LWINCAFSFRLNPLFESCFNSIIQFPPYIPYKFWSHVYMYCKSCITLRNIGPRICLNCFKTHCVNTLVPRLVRH
jgi:hypothetical protein